MKEVVYTYKIDRFCGIVPVSQSACRCCVWLCRARQMSLNSLHPGWISRAIKSYSSVLNLKINGIRCLALLKPGNGQSIILREFSQIRSVSVNNMGEFLILLLIDLFMFPLIMQPGSLMDVFSRIQFFSFEGYSTYHTVFADSTKNQVLY